MPTERKAIAVIPARWDSSRFPGKPLAPILNKPMVQWVVEQAQKARLISDVVVATDDKRILNAVHNFGGQGVMTCKSHLSGTDRVAEVIRERECDIVINVQGDEPLIPPENIDLAVQSLLEDSAVMVSTLMVPIRTIKEMFDPNISKVVVDGNGRALYFSRAPIPYNRETWPNGFVQEGEEKSTPQSVLGYKHIGLYGFRRSFLLEFPSLKSSKLERIEKLEQLRILENGYPIVVKETDKDSVGVDRKEDLAAVERIIAKTIS